MSAQLSLKNITGLALGGAAPVRETWLPYGRHSVSADDIDAVVKVLKSDWLTQGPDIAEFEQAVADHCGVAYAVAVNNGTAALHAAYFAAGIADNDEVVMPGMSFAATANAALYLKAKPVFADVQPGNGNISVECAERALTANTRAIVGVDFGGLPCDLTDLSSLAKNSNVPFIVDGAHSLGATYLGAPAAQVADMTTFSFHPVKTITTGEGGMIVTNNREYAERMRLFRSHGIDKNSDNFVEQNQGPWYHEMKVLGFNYRMTDFQAALGLSQVRRLDKFVARRREIAQLYREQMKSIKSFLCLDEKKDAQSAYHLFPILVADEPFAEKRKFVFEALHAENIGVQVHYMPIYRHPYYRQQVTKDLPLCPETDKFSARVLSLPMFPAMTDGDVADVLTALRKIDKVL